MNNYSYIINNVYELFDNNLIYHKLQKLCGRKVSQFIGFYHNVGKTFVVLFLIIMKTTCEYISALKMAVIKLVGKSFAVSQKSVKTAKVFFRVGFVVYGILIPKNQVLQILYLKHHAYYYLTLTQTINTPQPS